MYHQDSKGIVQVTSTSHLALYRLTASLRNPLRPYDHCNVTWDECPLGSWAHEAQTLESVKDHNSTVSRVPHGYIMALRYQFGGFGMGRDDEQASIMRWENGTCTAANARQPRRGHVEPV